MPEQYQAGADGRFRWQDEIGRQTQAAGSDRRISLSDSPSRSPKSDSPNFVEESEKTRGHTSTDQLTYSPPATVCTDSPTKPDSYRQPDSTPPDSVLSGLLLCFVSQKTVMFCSPGLRARGACAKFAYKKDAEIVVRADLRTVACWPLQRQVAKHAPIQMRNASSLLPHVSHLTPQQNRQQL